MQNLLTILKKEIFPISLILILAFARLIPHPPNFTPIISVAILSSFFFRNINLAIIVLLISMLISDFLIGFHKYIFFTYIPLVIITLTFKDKILKYKNMLFYSFIGVIIFYLISNFGVWILDKNYEKNIYGLINCYIAALPFLKNSIISTIFYTYLTFSTYNFSKKLIFKS